MKSMKEQKHALVKQAILEVAEALFIQGGTKAVNIRKIAKKIGYSPANIYKYFKHKEDIIHQLLMMRMQDIAKSIQDIPSEGKSIREMIKAGFHMHIKNVLKYGEHYKTVMLSDDPLLLERTRMLKAEDMRKLPAQRMLINHIKKGIDQGEFKDIDPVLTAQVIWASMFGLMIRIITESFDDIQAIEHMIDHYFYMMFSGIKS